MATFPTKYTEDQVKDFSRQIKDVYAQAAKEVEGKLKSFTERHEAKASQLQKQVDSGVIDKEDYKAWLQGQMFQGKQWRQKLEGITKVYTSADSKAREILNGTSKNVFTEAANYTAYDIEKDLKGAVSFDLYDEKTVEKLIKDNPKMLPEWKIDEEKDYTWNEKRVQNAVAQGIIQGESIKDISKRLCTDLATDNASKMDLFARTAITGAQNAGRIERLHESEEMGIEVKKKWLATLDEHTRDTHRDLDGQEKPVDEPFEVDDMTIDYPGDPSCPYPELVYNCRCTLIYTYPKYRQLDNSQRREQETGNVINYVTYKEWKASRQTEGKTPVGEQQRTVHQVVKDYSDKIDALQKESVASEEKYSDLFGKTIISFGTDEYDALQEELEKTQARISEIATQIENIREERDTYLAVRDEQQIRQAFGIIDKPHEISDDANAVNRITADPRSMNNCGYCSLAYDARRRGIDCHALLQSGANNNQVAQWWDGLQLTSASSYYGQDAMDEIISAAKSFGDGARGIIQIDYSMTTGHYFMFEVSNGECVFVDAQTGSTSFESAQQLFATARPGTIRYGRTDDKELTRFALLSLEKGKAQ